MTADGAGECGDQLLREWPGVVCYYPPLVDRLDPGAISLMRIPPGFVFHGHIAKGWHLPSLPFLLWQKSQLSHMRLRSLNTAMHTSRGRTAEPSIAENLLPSYQSASYTLLTLPIRLAPPLPHCSFAMYAMCAGCAGSMAGGHTAHRHIQSSWSSQPPQ